MMNFVKTSLVAAALLGAFATPAMAEKATGGFEREGVTYAYSTQVTNAATHISGTNSAGDRYDLTVRNGVVRGTYNGRPISFVASNEKAGKLMEVARR